MRIFLFGAFFWGVLCLYPNLLYANDCIDELTGDTYEATIDFSLSEEKQIRYIKLVDRNSREAIFEASTLLGGEGFITQAFGAFTESNLEIGLSYDRLGNILKISFVIPKGSYLIQYYSEKPDKFNYILVGTNTFEVVETAPIKIDKYRSETNHEDNI